MILNLALDRIIKLDYDLKATYLKHDFDADAYYKDVIGVTVNSGDRPQNILLWVDRFNAPYVITKPLHHSQQIEKTLEDGSIEVSIHVQINYELERLILGFGDTMKVLKPQRLRTRIASKLYSANYLYKAP